MIDDTIAAQLAIHSRSISTLFLPLIDFMSHQFVFWKTHNRPSVMFCFTKKIEIYSSKIKQCNCQTFPLQTCVKIIFQSLRMILIFRLFFDTTEGWVHFPIKIKTENLKCFLIYFPNYRNFLMYNIYMVAVNFN